MSVDLHANFNKMITYALYGYTNDNDNTNDNINDDINNNVCLFDFE